MMRFVLAILYVGTVAGTGTWMYLHNGKTFEVIAVSISVACALAFLYILVEARLRVIDSMLYDLYLLCRTRTVDSLSKSKNPT